MAASLQRRNVAILAATQMLYLIASITVMTLSGVVGLTLGPDPDLATLPVAMMTLGTLLSTFPASLFMKRVGRRLGFMAGAGLGGMAGGLVSFAAIASGSFALFCIGNLLFGLYQGFAMYYRFAAADVASEDFRSRAISYVMAGGVLAAFLGPLNAGAVDWIPAVPMGAPYLVAAALAVLAMGLLAFLRVPASGEPHPGEPSRPLRQIAARPGFAVAVLSAASGYAIMILVMTATPLAMRAQGYGMVDVALIMQMHVLGMFVPSFFTGGLIARFGLRPVLLTGAALLATAVGTANLGQTIGHFAVALIALGIGWNFLFVGGSALLASLHSEAERGKVQGLNEVIVFSMVALGSFLSGTLLNTIGWQALNLAVLPLILLVAVAVAVAGWRGSGAGTRPELGVTTD